MATIKKITPLAGNLVEVEFEDGTRAQYDKDKLGTPAAAKPEDHIAQVRELLAGDSGKGADEGGKS